MNNKNISDFIVFEKFIFKQYSTSFELIKITQKKNIEIWTTTLEFQKLVSC
jgi:hypothetical protein